MSKHINIKIYFSFVNTYKNLYHLFGIPQYCDIDEIDKKELKRRADNMLEQQTITRNEYELLQKFIQVLTDERLKEIHDDDGVETLLKTDHFENSIHFEFQPESYIDFYDLFGVEPTKSYSDIEHKIKTALQEYHPDQTDEHNSEFYDELLTARDVLENNIEQYYDLGHRQYVQEHPDLDLSLDYLGRTSYFDAKQPDVDDLIAFDPENISTDPTNNEISMQNYSNNNKSEQPTVNEDNDETDQKPIAIAGIPLGFVILSYVITGDIILTTIFFILSAIFAGVLWILK